MTKQRHCFVTQVGDAIEKLVVALDPERSKPFGGDILDLLEWAERDALVMRQRLEQAHADIASLHDQLEEPQITQDEYKLELEQLRQQLETERMRLAACGVVALSNTPESAAKARDMLPDYRSASCDDVARAVDREMKLRQQLATSKEELSRARLQNAIVYGTSHPEIYKTKEDELREQVTLLRAVMNRIAFSRTGQCTDLAKELFAREEWAAEALSATEPKP